MTIREIFRKSLWFQLLLVSVMGMLVCNPFTNAEDAEKWMSNANLRAAVIETLELAEGVSLTKEHLKSLLHVEALNSEISNLSGLEYATNLMGLGLCGNQISDLSPLSDLVQIEHLSLCGNQISDISPLSKLTNLKLLDLGLNQITDITPLDKLVNLENLNLGDNQIVDISSLARLMALQELSLTHNNITDISPLAKLVRLAALQINNNPIQDFSALQHLNLTIFKYDMLCKVPSLPVEERILTRSFPSVFKAWDSLIIPGLPKHGGIDYHDLAFNLTFGLNWQTTPSQSTRGLATQVGGNLEAAQDERDRLLTLNPNIVSLQHIVIHGVSPSEFPQDSDFLLRDENGEIVYSEIINAAMINLMNPKVQDHF
ncbi:MAG: leucine-rich repeat domain-containing protein, partial [Candidatus Poribacteria bacterium]|nr:leucine-rich repeat domain-containing protein [Candidatus Poribacteria bacterium]